jgi:hypothetical protein
MRHLLQPRNQRRRPLTLPQPHTTLRRPMPSPPGLDLVARHAGWRARFVKLAALAAGTDPRIQQVVTLWSRLTPAQKDRITIDRVVELTGIPSGEFIGTVVAAACEAGIDVADLVAAAASLPEQRAITDPEGWKERRLLYEHLGFVPRPALSPRTPKAVASAFRSRNERTLTRRSRPS